MTKDSLLKWAKRDNWFQYRETISELNYNIRPFTMEINDCISIKAEFPLSGIISLETLIR